jgi:uncharacterized integral membrane protein
MTHLLLSLLTAALLTAIALFSVQNATPTAINFLAFQSVKMPLGLLLAGGFAIGLVSGSLILVGGRSR